MLALITSITPDLDLIEPVMAALLSILENSSVSSQLTKRRISS